MNAGIAAMKTLGPSHTERAYEDCIVNYFYKRRIPYVRQKQFYQTYENEIIQIGIADLEVDHKVILELKANLKEINDDHKAQLRRYLRAANKADGLQRTGLVMLFSKSGSLYIWSPDLKNNFNVATRVET